jgi:hypothetical protein
MQKGENMKSKGPGRHGDGAYRKRRDRLEGIVERVYEPNGDCEGEEGRGITNDGERERPAEAP